MNDTPASGFEEIAHTADWSLHAWAPTFEDMLREAVEGMYELAGVVVDDDHPGEPISLRVHGKNREEQVVALLSELVYVWSTDRMAVEDMMLDVSPDAVEVDAIRRPVVDQSKEIKAVTFYDLNVSETSDGLETTVTFDV